MRCAVSSLPQKISDQEFWAMVVSFSENGGTFVSDNIISDEIEFQRAIPDVQKTKSNGVYMGVGPEQNFTYITAFKPSMAFIVDIRRENLLLHLTYKALIELSPDRVEFLSRLFARRRPDGVGPDSTARVLFEAFGAMPVSEDWAQANLRSILGNLEQAHRFLLSDDDKRGITEVYRSLYVGGPHMHGDFGGGSWIPSYAQLMAQTDLQGHDHSFIESEQNFQTLKEYESKNLIVPLVGDFAGERAIRSVGRYLRDHNATVSTFYTSNVEEYLFKGGKAQTFFANVATLPFTDDAFFIRSFFTHTDAGLHTLLDSIGECLAAVMSGEIRTYADVISRSTSPRP
jgi:hypothetical protein